MKKVLILYYSQTGQLTEVVKSFAKPLEIDENVELVYQAIEPKKAFPFPCGILKIMEGYSLNYSIYTHYK
jgi:hypothetical protein